MSLARCFGVPFKRPHCMCCIITFHVDLVFTHYRIHKQVAWKQYRWECRLLSPRLYPFSPDTGGGHKTSARLECLLRRSIVVNRKWLWLIGGSEGLHLNHATSVSAANNWALDACWYRASPTHTRRSLVQINYWTSIDPTLNLGKKSCMVWALSTITWSPNVGGVSSMGWWSHVNRFCLIAGESFNLFCIASVEGRVECAKKLWLIQKQLITEPWAASITKIMSSSQCQHLRTVPLHA